MLSVFQQFKQYAYNAGHHFCLVWCRPLNGEIIITAGVWVGLAIIALQCYYNVCIEIEKGQKQVSIKRFVKEIWLM